MTELLNNVIYQERETNSNHPYSNLSNIICDRATGTKRKGMESGTGGRLIGPGHFGRVVVEDGVEKISCHYESDLDQGGHSVLGIRPLLWKDGWPVAGDNFRDGTYEIESERRGYSLELAVDKEGVTTR